MINTFTAETFTAPVENLIALNQSVFKKAIEAQTKAVYDAFDLTNTQVKAVAEIKDVTSLNEFVKEQSELVKTSFEAAAANSKTLAEDVKAYNEEVVKIMTNSVTDTPAKAPAKRAPAKKAA